MIKGNAKENHASGLMPHYVFVRDICDMSYASKSITFFYWLIFFFNGLEKVNENQ